jgi:hypothetical protein
MKLLILYFKNKYANFNRQLYWSHRWSPHNCLTLHLHLTVPYIFLNWCFHDNFNNYILKVANQLNCVTCTKYMCVRACVPQRRTKNEGPRLLSLSLSLSLSHSSVTTAATWPSTLGHSSTDNTSQCICLHSPSPYPMLTWQQCSEGLRHANHYLQHVTDSFRKTTERWFLHLDDAVSIAVYLSDSQYGKHGGYATPCFGILQLFEYRLVYRFFFFDIH